MGSSRNATRAIAAVLTRIMRKNRDSIAVNGGPDRSSLHPLRACRGGRPRGRLTG